MSCHRVVVSALCTLVVALTASRASADEEPEPTAKAPSAHAFSVAFTGNAGWVRVNEASYHPNAAAAVGQIAASYRLSPTVSVGALVSHGVLDTAARLTRAAGEARYHVVHGRYVDVWGDVELGIAASYDEGPTIFYGADDGGGTPRNPGPHTRFAPMGGVGAGVDVLPLRYISIGLEGRVFGAVFSYQEDSLSGLTPGAFLGLTLALHVPLSG